MRNKTNTKDLNLQNAVPYTSHALLNPRLLTVNNVITNDNIQSAAYLWVTNRSTALSMYGDISLWDTSKVTNMEDVFGYFSPLAFFSYWSKNFNADLSRWNTSRVTSMNGMFDGAYVFNGNISTWDTSKVTNMSEMFWEAKTFNCDISTWDTSKVTSMMLMFSTTQKFNINLSMWNISQVTDMFGMFYNAIGFRQIICWDTRRVIDFTYMFRGSNGGFSATQYPGCLTSSPTKKPTFKPTGPTVRPSMRPNYSHFVYGRYIRLARVDRSPDVGRYSNGYTISILGIDVYDQYGAVITNQSTPFINEVWENNWVNYGPQFLVDGLHSCTDSIGQKRVPTTSDNPDAYMELDFGKDILMSKIVIWNDNRAFCCQIRIIGTELTIRNNLGALVYSRKNSIDDVELHYTFDTSTRAQSVSPTLSIPTITAGKRSAYPTYSMKPTLADGSRLIYGRYIRLSRVHPSPDTNATPFIINILGLDVYDDKGTFISNKSTPSISAILDDNPAWYGPQFLTDGGHQAQDVNGTSRLPATKDVPNIYMQLDFGQDVAISTAVLWNRQDCCSHRIIGTKLSIINDAGVENFGQIMTADDKVYHFQFGYQAPTTFRTFWGPIRNILGKCINVPNSNFVRGQRLEIYQCNGGTNQQWTRPTSTDLRLQTQNNMCLSTVGNTTDGSAVVLSVCNATASSQKWIFDGRKLHPFSYSDLCLTIRDGISIDAAPLILSVCSNHPASAWIEYSTALVSKKSSTTFHLLCPVGSKVVNISGRGGGWLHQITMMCDDANNTILGPLGGNNTDFTANPFCAMGYTSMAVLSGDYVGQFRARCSGSSFYTKPIGISNPNEAMMTTASSVTEFAITTNLSLSMQGDNRIIGMQGTGDLYVEAITLLYSTGSAWPTTLNPTAHPSAKPILSSAPTGKPTLLPSHIRPSVIPSTNPSTPSTRKPSAMPSTMPTIWKGSWVTHVSPLYGTRQSYIIGSYDSCPPGSRVVAVEGYGQDYIHRLQATCDDKSKKILGPWGALGVLKSSFSCKKGIKGWNITHGSYIGSISFTCLVANNSFGSSSIGVGNAKQSGLRNVTILSYNQSIIGFRVYNDTDGIYAMLIEYADFNATGRCYNSRGELTRDCPTRSDYLAVLWGFLTITGIVAPIVFRLRYLKRKRRKVYFKKIDEILSLK